MLIFFVSIYIILIFYYRNKYFKYKFYEKNTIEYIVDYLLMPFMEIATGGKDSHWWDWKIIPEEKVSNPNISTKLDPGVKPLRKFKRYPIFGLYNLHGLRSLYITLFVLKDTAIIRPKNYTGEWILITKGGHDEDDKPEYKYAQCKFILKGSVKHLIDGPQEYIGQTLDGKAIELIVDRVVSRYKNKEILFV